MKVTVAKYASLVLATTLILSCGTTAGIVPSQTIIDEEKVLPSAADLYEQKIAGITLKVLSSPKETTKGKAFSAPYTVKAEDSNGNAVESLEISVVAPSSRKNGEIVFSETTVATDSEGKISFLPSALEYAFDSEISFMPSYKNDAFSSEESAQVKKIAESKSVKAPFKVQTNLKSAGGVIAIVDFNQSGKAISSNPVSSSNLLMTLMQLGFTKIGNIDLTNQVVAGDKAKIQAKARSIVGNSSNFLIYGTVKIDSSGKTDAGFSYTLSGEANCMDLKSGDITFTTKKSITVTEKTDWAALDKARKSLAAEIAREIKYGI